MSYNFAGYFSGFYGVTKVSVTRTSRFNLSKNHLTLMKFPYKNVKYKFFTLKII